MWSVRALFEDGTSLFTQFAQSEGTHTPVSELLPHAQHRWGDSREAHIPWHLLEAAVNKGPSPWADPLPMWASEGELNATGISVDRNDDGEIFLSLGQAGRTVSQHPSVVMAPIPPGAVELVVQYEWDRAEEHPFVDSTFHAVGELLPTLDGRLYSGTKSAILETNEPPDATWMQHAPTRIRRWVHVWRLRVQGLTGLFVGRIARRFIDSPRPVLHDPGFISRLQREQALNSIGADCKEIGQLDTFECGGPLVIAVHGSFSCAVELAAILKTAVRGNATIARFEHDTFLPISANVNELVEEVERLYIRGVQKVLLVSHSRGGLVACQAALLLRHKCPDLDLEIWTAGTPHRGTPIAGLGSRASFAAGVSLAGLNAYYRTCARRDPDLLRVTTAEAAASYLYSFDALPPGISAMSPGSSFIDIHSLHVGSVGPRTWGGVFDPMRSTSFGHGVLVSSALALFDRQPNDLVVPAESAILDGSSPLAECDHFSYFSRMPLESLLAQYLAVETNVVLP